MTFVFPISSPFHKPSPNSRGYRKYCEELSQIYGMIVSGEIEFFTKYSSHDLCQLQLTNVM